MRLGAGAGGLAGRMGEAAESARAAFLARMSELTEAAPAKVMLGDATVRDQDTFDPGRVEAYLGRACAAAAGWEPLGVSTTGGEGLRRMSAKLEARAGSYLLTARLSVQFHVLLYYRPEQRVVECQRELDEVIEAAGGAERDIAERGERVAAARLGEAGYAGMGAQELFESLYADDGLREGLYSEIQEGAGALREKIARRSELLSELDSLLLETYQTSQLLIDDARLVTGEEGFVCSFDLEMLRDGGKDGTLDARRIPEAVGSELLGLLGAMGAAVSDAGNRK